MHKFVVIQATKHVLQLILPMPNCTPDLIDFGRLGRRHIEAPVAGVEGLVEQGLAQRGRRLIGWDEILEGGLAPDATVMAPVPEWVPERSSVPLLTVVGPE